MLFPHGAVVVGWAFRAFRWTAPVMQVGTGGNYNLWCFRRRRRGGRLYTPQGCGVPLAGRRWVAMEDLNTTYASLLDQPLAS
jgi:hypothetical protein